MLPHRAQFMGLERNTKLTAQTKAPRPHTATRPLARPHPRPSPPPLAHITCTCSPCPPATPPALPARPHRVVFQLVELVHRHQLHRVHAQRSQVVQLLDHTSVRPCDSGRAAAGAAGARSSRHPPCPAPPAPLPFQPCTTSLVAPFPRLFCDQGQEPAPVEGPALVACTPRPHAHPPRPNLLTLPQPPHPAPQQPLALGSTALPAGRSPGAATREEGWRVKPRTCISYTTSCSSGRFSGRSPSQSNSRPGCGGRGSAAAICGQVGARPSTPGAPYRRSCARGNRRGAGRGGSAGCG